MALDLVGKIFGDLTVIAKHGRVYVTKSSVWRTQWKCLCFCGKESIKFTHTLRSGKTQSCGCCEWHIHHNESYVSWMSMKSRCDNQANKDYSRYGGRGIRYEAYWDKFENFYRDMGDPPKDKITGERLSLDRIDNNGMYCKANCKWSTRSEQQLNKG